MKRFEATGWHMLVTPAVIFWLETNLTTRYIQILDMSVAAAHCWFLLVVCHNPTGVLRILTLFPG
jgi:hypothetical protein